MKMSQTSVFPFVLFRLQWKYMRYSGKVIQISFGLSSNLYFLVRTLSYNLYSKKCAVNAYWDDQ